MAYHQTGARVAPQTQPQQQSQHTNTLTGDVMGDEFSRLLLAARRRCTGAPTDDYVRQLEKDIKRGRACPGRMVAAYLACAARDGAASEDLCAMALAILDLYGTTPTAPPPAEAFPTLCEEETVIDGALDRAQMHALTHDTPEALLAVREAAQAQIAITRRVMAAADVRRLSKAARRTSAAVRLSSYTVAA